jgi:hypothetical protein
MKLIERLRTGPDGLGQCCPLAKSALDEIEFLNATIAKQQAEIERLQMTIHSQLDALERILCVFGRSS